MSLLDRLRGQPGWQHEDPLVRASAVDDLENDAQDVFEAIASEDADPGVRLAAVVRLSDPETIGRIARTDSDGQVRDEAISMLRSIAVEATEPDAGEAALAGLSEERDLGEVARTARVEAVSRSALGRLDSQKAIGAVARRSTHRAVRGRPSTGSTTATSWPRWRSRPTIARSPSPRSIGSRPWAPPIATS